MNFLEKQLLCKINGGLQLSYPHVLIPMNKISKVLFWGDCISLEIYCIDQNIEKFKRLCFIAGVQYQDEITCKDRFDIKIIINKLKQINRIFPELKKMMPDDKHLNEEYVQTYKKFLGEV